MTKKYFAILMACVLIFAAGCQVSQEKADDGGVGSNEEASSNTEKNEELSGEEAKEAKGDSEQDLSSQSNSELASSEQTIYVGQGFVTASTDPANGSAGWALTTHGVSENLFTVDKEGILISRLVDEINQESEKIWKVKLKEGVLFSDGSPLLAEEVAKGLNRTNENSGAARATVGKILYKATGPLTMTIETERPTKILKSVLAEWSNVVYKYTDENTIAFTGPYVVKEHVPNEKIVLTPNPHYPDAQKRQDVVIQAIKDKATLKLAFESGEIDFAFPLPSEFAESLKKDGHVIKGLDAGYQYFAFLNLNTPALNDKKVRQALNMGINRDELILALKGGNVPTGAFAHYFPFAGKEKLEFNLDKAKGLLDEAGWKASGNGMREKDGKSLQIKIVTYPQRPDLVTMIHVINSQLKQLGIEVKTEISEDIGNVAKNGEFDMMLYAQHTAPTGEPSFFLNQMFRSDGPNNYAHYKSKDFDKSLEELGMAVSDEDVIKASVNAQNILVEDAPVLFLVDPVWYVGLSEKVKNYEPWGADYHIIRGDLGL